MTREALLQEAMKLSHADRATVAAELLASLEEAPGEDEEDVQRAWAVEIERRARHVLAGQSQATPWPEVQRRLEERLSG
jgi:putative addiction module component (TIGR02574 family)